MIADMNEFTEWFHSPAAFSWTPYHCGLLARDRELPGLGSQKRIELRFLATHVWELMTQRVVFLAQRRNGEASVYLVRRRRVE